MKLIRLLPPLLLLSLAGLIPFTYTQIRQAAHWDTELASHYQNINHLLQRPLSYQEAYQAHTRLREIEATINSFKIPALTRLFMFETESITAQHHLHALRIAADAGNIDAALTLWFTVRPTADTPFNATLIRSHAQQPGPHYTRAHLALGEAELLQNPKQANSPLRPEHYFLKAAMAGSTTGAAYLASLYTEQGCFQRAYFWHNVSSHKPRLLKAASKTALNAQLDEETRRQITRHAQVFVSEPALKHVYQGSFCPPPGT